MSSPGIERWPCFYETPAVTKVIDAVVQKQWQQTGAKTAPFGPLRRMWRTQHCMRLNPYGSDACPYKKGECGIAFAHANRISLTKREPKKYFSKLVRSLAASRADDKPSARDVPFRTYDTHGPGDPGAADAGDHARLDDAPGGGLPDRRQEAPGVSRSADRPQRVGELLGQINLRPHQGRPKDGQEGTKR